ncbi:hypothetical protein N866_05165 [Actinotalea ferrariae CF5-4]|uniref:Glycosyltransferase 2-like domain-containing protein n=1 Tax=Actinotalea ferrariae CF5-4 TaxID=948458 RepID=A0A021VUA4_9CELL|nr:glycosyltransferase family A protein [Actinotalea ferrariae]EYR64769.1 hypothetical protein N866_05165 [Actinotalea ferrariae CF5-4]
MTRSGTDQFDVSVVIPAYNSAPWLPTTLEALAVALRRTSWRAEVLVVDDGSTDATVAEMRSLAASYEYDLRVVTQPNQGVFMAVWTGLQEARAEWVLILNSRLLLHTGAVAHLEAADALSAQHPWNGHVVTDPDTPLVGRFWEVPTGVFWRTYLSDPRPMLITPRNFDAVPKGTGCLLVRRQLMIEAYEHSWPAADARFTSDDTKLLRHVAAAVPIRLDPGFSATYRPRTTVRKFLQHAGNRGTLFVDSYAGTSPLRDVVLIALVGLPPVALAVAVGAAASRAWRLLAAVGAAAGAAVAAPAVIALASRTPRRAVLSYLVYVVPFGAVFWRGLARGLVVHRASFGRRRSRADS